MLLQARIDEDREVSQIVTAETRCAVERDCEKVMRDLLG